MKNLEEQIKTNLSGGYINRRITEINRESENLKENTNSKENLKMQRSLRLVLNENRTENQKLYDKIQNNYMKKVKEQNEKNIEQMWDDRDEKIKQIITKAKENYYMEDDFIEQLTKVLYKNGQLSDIIAFEKLIDFCYICNIYDMDTFKEKKDTIQELLFPLGLKI